MMKKVYYLLGVVCFLVCTSCSKKNACGFKESSVTATDNERTALADSLEKYGITATLEHPSGFRYKINKAGTGDTTATLCSVVTCEYWGGFFNGNGFDSTTTTPFVFSLGQMIVGWQKGIPLVKAGGEITLYIPPSLAYGNQSKPNAAGQVLIPANSYLVFRVSVSKIQ